MMEVKDMIIGGIATVALGGTVVNTISNHKMKKRVEKDEEVLKYLASIHAQPTPQPAPQQPQQAPVQTQQVPQQPVPQQ